MSGEVVARVFVAGRPRTKGHIEPVHIPGRSGRPCVYGSGKDRPLTQKWMKILGTSLQRQLGIVLSRDVALKRVRRIDAGPYAGPVEIHCFFRFDRELSMAEAAEEGEVWPSHTADWPTARGIGDEDTLRRSVLDALTKSGVIKDDSLSVGGMNYKRWCTEGEDAGVLIVVTRARTVEEIHAMFERELGLPQ